MWIPILLVAADITPQNVAKLSAVWTYATQGLHQPRRGRPSAFETTPLYANGMLYGTSAIGRVFALDPATGKEHWSFDPKIDLEAGYGDFTNRGVSYWPGGLVIAVSVDARMFALDARTGQQKWTVNLREGLRLPPKEFSAYEQTSPPCVIGDIVVAGSAIADNGWTDNASGEVRGFDVRTGKLLWTWDPIPNSKTGGANAWSRIVGDPARGLVFVPTGSPSPDYYGGERKPRNHGNSVVALEAKTGKLRWAFQTVHHDLWDYDVAAPPLLLKAKGRDAVAVGSKSGNLFLLDRDTGAPLFPVEERAVPKSDVPGEEASATQPFSIQLVPRTFVAWGPTPEAKRWCEEAVSKLRYDGIFTPPSLRGTLAYPGNIGGLHWGGMTYDARLKLIVAPVNNLPAIVQLIPRAEYRDAQKSDKFSMEFAPQWGTPFGMARRLLLSPQGLPCNAPPWGTLAAVDANTGQVKWQVPLGKFGEVPGTINLGGPLALPSGVTFIGATLDGYFRAFSSATGLVLWEAKLPASARSTPMTYTHRGRQYVAVAAGGHDPKFGPLDDKLVVFALPK